MKRFFYSSLFLFLPVFVSATHVIGGELTYQCMGGNVYKLRVALWIDCPGVTPGSVSVRACSNSCNVSTSYNLPQILGTCQPSFPMCSYPNSACISGPDIGVLKCEYETTVTLTSCTDWIFYTTYCCRSAAATNVINPLASGMAVVATLDNVNGPCNTSPTFFNEPIAFACCNQGNIYNQITGEPDGDSLVYSLYNPLDDNANGCTTTPAVPLVYANPFTYLQFLTTLTPITLNPANGDIFIHPINCNEGSVIGVKVSEYRNGNLVGTIMRDIIVRETTMLTGNVENEQDDFSITFDQASQVVSVRGDKQPDLLWLYDVSGRELRVLNNTKQTNVSGFNPGIYFVLIESGGSRYSYKILKN